jgi:hypothetical protein
MVQQVPGRKEQRVAYKIRRKLSGRSLRSKLKLMVAMNMQMQDEIDKLKGDQSSQLVKPASLQEMAKLNQEVNYSGKSKG